MTKRERKRLSIGAILRNEASYLLEWIAFHRVVGVEHFFLYDNVSSDGCSEMLTRLDRAGVITRIHWPRRPGEPPQRPAYRDLFARFGHTTDFMAVVDGDEFIVPRSAPSILDVLPLYADPEIGAVAVQWKMFGPNRQERREPGLVIERFTACEPALDAHIKTISKPSHVLVQLTHNCELRHGRYVRDDGGPVQWAGTIGTSAPRATHLQVNHYFTKSLEEWRTRRLLGKADRGPHTERNEQEFQRFWAQGGSCDLALRFVPQVLREIEQLQAIVQESAIHASGEVTSVEPTKVRGSIKVRTGDASSVPIRVLVNDTEEYLGHAYLATPAQDDGTTQLSFEIPVTPALQLQDKLFVSLAETRHELTNPFGVIGAFVGHEAAQTEGSEAEDGGAGLLSAKAKALAGQKRYDEALAVLDSLRQTTNQVEVARAEILKNAGRRPEARACLQRVLERNPRHGRALFQLGLIEQDEGRLEGAQQLYERAVQSEGRWTRAHYHLGLMRYKLGNYDGARTAFEKVLSLEPDHPRAYAYKRRCIKRLDDAAAKAHVASIQLAAVEARSAGDLPRTVELLLEAVSWDPWNLDLLNQLAQDCLDDGRVAEAEAHYRKVLRSRPSDADALFGLGLTAQRLGRFEDARRQFRAAASAKGKWARATYHEAVVTHKLGALDEARELALHVLKLNPKHEKGKALLDKLDKELSSAAAAAAPVSAPAAQASDG